MIHHNKIPEYLSSIDIFAMPSVFRSETFGVSAIEAQAMGIPVVASRVGGVPEAVIDGITGLLVKPGDPMALAEALERLILDPELRKKMGIKGREFVESKYNWSNNLEQMIKVY